MDDDKRRLISAVLQFLRGELKAPYLNSENIEGLEVAIQCLESVYDINEETFPTSEPSLLEIYQTYRGNAIMNLPDASDEDKEQAEFLKFKGNAAMNSQLFNDALEYYTKAIKLNMKNAVYYCNRAAAYSKLHDHKSAIRDCKMAIELDPKYSKAYGRLGLAYTGLEDYEKALENYIVAATLDPDNEGYKNNVVLAEKKVSEQAQMKGDNQTQSTAGNVQEQSSNGPAPNISLLDLNIFSNPQLLNIATQMLTDPSMQSVMSTIMEGTIEQGGGVDALLRAGQQLAQHMQSENPALIEQLRRTLDSDVRQQQPPQSGQAQNQSSNQSPNQNSQSSNLPNPPEKQP